MSAPPLPVPPPSGITLEGLISSGVIAVLFVGFMSLLYLALDRSTPFNDTHEMIKAKNYPYMVQRSALILAPVIGMTTSLMGAAGAQRFSELLWVVLAGVIMVVGLLIMSQALSAHYSRVPESVSSSSNLITDGDGNRLTGWKLRAEAMRHDTMAIAWTKAGFYLAFGLIVAGTFNGSAPDKPTAFASIATFIALGLVLLYVGYIINDKLAYWLFGYKIRDCVSAGKRSAGYEAACFAIAQGAIMAVAVSGDFTGWIPAFVGFFGFLLLATFLTFPVRWALNHMFARHTSLKEIHDTDNHAAAAMLSMLLPISAVVVCTFATLVV
jgi:hypothetical protein